MLFLEIGLVTVTAPTGSMPGGVKGDLNVVQCTECAALIFDYHTGTQKSGHEAFHASITTRILGALDKALGEVAGRLARG